MKQISGAIIGILVLMSFAFIEAWNDYHWASSNIAKMKADGWMLAAQTDNCISITHPWSLFINYRFMVYETR